MEFKHSAINEVFFFRQARVGIQPAARVFWPWAPLAAHVFAECLAWWPRSFTKLHQSPLRVPHTTRHWFAPPLPVGNRRYALPPPLPVGKSAVRPRPCRLETGGTPPPPSVGKLAVRPAPGSASVV